MPKPEKISLTRERQFSLKFLFSATKEGNETSDGHKWLFIIMSSSREEDSLSIDLFFMHRFTPRGFKLLSIYDELSTAHSTTTGAHNRLEAQKKENC